MIAITERQQMVLDFITRFTQTHGYSPTVRDIAAHLGVSSPSGVNRHLEALEKKGWLKKTGASRGIVLTSHGGQSIPLKEEQMMEVRRSDREITPQESIDILDTAEYGILSTVGNDGQPYGVPLSYVHKGSIYFHCAISGHKLENIEHNAKVSFCVVGKTKVLPDKFGIEYESAVVFGRVSEVNGAERHHALLWLLEKYCSDFIEEGKRYIEQKDKITKVFKIEIARISGKARR